MSHCRDIPTATVEQGDWQFTSQTLDAFKDIMELSYYDTFMTLSRDKVLVREYICVLCTATDNIQHYRQLYASV